MDEKSFDDPPKQSLMFFGRNVAEIPCFRSSFLYGISIGIGAGFIGFLCTSKPRLATHLGFGTFMCTTLFYWTYCRYQWSSQRFQYSIIKEGMKKQALFEGTEVEREMNKKADSV